MKMKKRQKTAKQSVVEKTLTASCNNPSPTLDPDSVAKEPPDIEDSLMDLDASPECYLPDEEEVNKDLLYQVLAVNTVTRRQAIRTKALPFCEAIETVSIPYADNFHILLVKLLMKVIAFKIGTNTTLSTSLN
ncbi:hypothetical protein DSO57_1034920 [Entomophthora muscae]|uniref:Uncharacterized protein n=1 Tax=Entomophthora muscae TaxID=34485 RepID=A0ACC2RQL0_9FUNG|nr:hypothetical protein DSO57_1034920 [Entomophthora muscae]